MFHCTWHAVCSCYQMCTNVQWNMSLYIGAHLVTAASCMTWAGLLAFSCIWGGAYCMCLPPLYCKVRKEASVFLSGMQWGFVRERESECVCVYPDGWLSDVFHWSGISALSFDSTFLPGLLVLLSSPALSLSLLSPYSAVGPVVPSAFLKCRTVCFFRKVAPCWSS